ncbi:hypothetical protein ACFWUZ_20320 [Streptomyces sp. NPDC058646]|uniref:hypothetical protein n=1 Tax=Streptomyces sp. NPDC058646 TaxID=3346574 RepID=UPI00364FD32C
MQPEPTLPDQRKKGESGPDADTPDLLPATAGSAHELLPEPEPEPAARRRGRAGTPLLIAAAVVLGVLAGTVTGYAVQYHRAPTPLPPLAQQTLVAPEPLAPDDTTTHKTINANRWHRSDGDLSELLLEAPAGAKRISAPGYLGLAEYAGLYERPDRAFTALQGDGFRRVVSTAWEQGDRYTEIQMTQFKGRGGAVGDMGDSLHSISDDAGNPGSEVAGLPPADAHVWVFSELTREAGYEPMREARALVRRGDIVAEIFWVESRGAAISENDVIDLAKRQLERL